jgi:EpsI family protein
MAERGNGAPDNLLDAPSPVSAERSARVQTAAADGRTVDGSVALAPARPNPTARHWQRYLPVMVAAALATAGAALGLAIAFERLHASWTDLYSYSHGYLVLAMSLWLMVRALTEQPPASLRPSVLGGVALLAAVAAYALIEIVDVNIAMQGMLPILLLATIATIVGWGAAGRAVLPVGFLFFAIPVWNLLTVPLQDVTTAVVIAALRSTGITAFIEGYIVATPAGTFEIAQGCSGLHFFVVGLALAAFYGMNWYRWWSTRLLLFTVAGVVSMIANWIRVYTLIVVGDATDMQHYLIAEDHYLFGWVLYGVLMAPVLWLARRLEIAEVHRSKGLHVAQEARRSPTLAPGLAFIAAGAFAGVVLAAPSGLRAGTPAPADPIALPAELAASAEWRVAPPARDWRPRFHRPHRLLHSGYTPTMAPAQVDVYVARYDSQHPDAKLIYYRNGLDDGWQRVGSSVRRTDVGGLQRTVREIELGNRGERRLVWYWYWVGGYTAHDSTRAKLWEAVAALHGRRDGAVIALSAPCAIQCDTARAQMAEFLVHAGGALDAAAAGTPSGAQ